MSERVRAVRGFSGPRGSYAPGDEFDLPDGVDWLEAGLVEPIDGTDDGVAVLEGKDAEIPDGFTGLRDRGGPGWHDVIVAGEIVDKIQGREDAVARLESLT